MPSYEEALKNCIFRYVSGSQQYGTNHHESDTDYRGVFIAPLHYAFDIFQTSFVSGTIRQNLNAALDNIDDLDFVDAKNNIEKALETDKGDLSIGVETVHKTGEDEELQELRKFFKLAAGSNPNIIEFLYVEDLIDICTPEWEKIRENRHLFLSKKARYTFAGYAIQQLRRVKLHRSYLLNPPSHQPTRKEFGLDEMNKIPKNHQNAILSLPDEWIADHAKEMVLKEKRYASALQLWNSYHKWARERNPLRKELEHKFGFDTKHSLHLVRLCKMAEEILREGKVIVRRPDAEELKGILRGEWKYEDIESVADNLDSRLDSLYKNSPLQETPNYKKITELYRNICEQRYKVTQNHKSHEKDFYKRGIY